MPRAIWKGAISFGLVNVPVSLYPASQDSDIDFDWLDRRTMEPVGYKRVNKRTGKEVGKDDIVKGVKLDDGDYVVLSNDEIREAYPKTTQTITIEAFVRAQDISFVYVERPYYLEPLGKSAKVYALLREALAASSLIGIARLVMHTKEHLAALLPAGPALMLATLRWAGEIRGVEELSIPPAGKEANRLKDSELKMAQQLIQQMTAQWKPEQFTDEFSEAVRDLVQRKAQAGDTQSVEPLEEAPADARGSNVVDLTQLLRESLGRRAPASAGDGSASRSAKRSARSPLPSARPSKPAAKASHSRSRPAAQRRA